MGFAIKARKIIPFTGKFYNRKVLKNNHRHVGYFYHQIISLFLKVEMARRAKVIQTEAEKRFPWGVDALVAGYGADESEVALRQTFAGVHVARNYFTNRAGLAHKDALHRGIYIEVLSPERKEFSIALRISEGEKCPDCGGQKYCWKVSQLYVGAGKDHFICDFEALLEFLYARKLEIMKISFTEHGIHPGIHVPVLRTRISYAIKPDGTVFNGFRATHYASFKKEGGAIIFPPDKETQHLTVSPEDRI